jgi:hypothetical protein
MYLYYFDREPVTLVIVASPLLGGMVAKEGEHAEILATRKKEHVKR